MLWEKLAICAESTPKTCRAGYIPLMLPPVIWPPLGQAPDTEDGSDRVCRGPEMS